MITTRAPDGANKNNEKLVKKTFTFTEGVKAFEGNFIKKSFKSPVASSLTCPCLEPKRWPPEPPSWSPLDTQDFLENMGSALSFSIVDHIFTRQTTGSADHLDQSTSRHQHTDDIYDDLS